MEYRRRLLFKQIPWDEFMTYQPLFENVHTHLMEFIHNKMQDSNKTDIRCEQKLRIEEGMFGELDLTFGDIIIDYKTSINDDINMDWLVQLLCYKVLSDFNNRKINKLGILNPLRGWYMEIDVSDWKAHHNLVDYLLTKREEKLAASATTRCR